MLKVCKFGGSCTLTLNSLYNIEKLAKSYTRRIFVFSAIGRVDCKDEKLTDLFLRCEYSSMENINHIFDIIKNKFLYLINMTNIDFSIESKIDEIKNTFLVNRDINWLVSRGEYLTSLIMSKFLGIKFISAEKIIFFNKNKFDIPKIKNKLIYYFEKYKKIIIPGFYGIDENNRIKLLQRGGSDTTAAVIAKLLNFDYENWTDVQGVYEVNPKYIKSKQIKLMNYTDLKVMTDYDANVISSGCVDLLKNTNIKLIVNNINNISKTPTIIKKCNKKANFIVCKDFGNTTKICIQNKILKNKLVLMVKSVYKDIIIRRLYECFSNINIR